MKSLNSLSDAGVFLGTRFRPLVVGAGGGAQQLGIQDRADFEARISGLATSGALANNSFAFAKSAFAISPLRCAFRPFSSANVSKMPYLPGPILMAYQLIVSGSRSAIGCADFRNSSTSFSLPGWASSCAQIASFPMFVLLLRMRCPAESFGSKFERKIPHRVHNGSRGGPHAASIIFS